MGLGLKEKGRDLAPEAIASTETTSTKVSKSQREKIPNFNAMGERFTAVQGCKIDWIYGGNGAIAS